MLILDAYHLSHDSVVLPALIGEANGEYRELCFDVLQSRCRPAHDIL